MLPSQASPVPLEPERQCGHQGRVACLFASFLRSMRSIRQMNAAGSQFPRNSSIWDQTPLLFKDEQF